MNWASSSASCAPDRRPQLRELRIGAQRREGQTLIRSGPFTEGHPWRAVGEWTDMGCVSFPLADLRRDRC